MCIRDRLLACLSGMKASKKGEVFLNHSLKKKDDSDPISFLKLSIKQRYAHGMAYVTDDRHKYGLILDASVSTNIGLRSFNERAFSFLGLVNYRKINSSSIELIKKYDIRNADNGGAIVRGLSGGNQQKIIIARELTAPSSFAIIAQPTRGLDVGSIENIHDNILAAKKDGKGILLISYELEEIVKLSDRVLVMNAGKISGTLVGKGINIKNIGELMVGLGK